METIKKISQMRSLSRQLRREGKTLGFVPTMGFFHEGHLSLIQRSRETADITVVSLFVNPAQFGPSEDFKNYPRDLARDAGLARNEAVDCLFVPEAEEIYPQPFYTYVDVLRLSNVLCGASRVDHFRGVATIVAKLFNIVMPHFAFFGLKDAQQARIIEVMARDLNMDIEIIACPTVREPDGLAMSSRNSYLSKEERQIAPVLYSALCAAKEEFFKGERDSVKLKEVMRRMIESPHTRMDYIEISDTETLQPIEYIKNKALASLAVFVGKTRLIDNIIFEVKTL